MAKTKNSTTLLTYNSLGLLSVALVIGVIISGSHLKDVLAHVFMLSQTAPLATDANKKVSGELHNHIEKQTLKTMVKAVGDDGARTDRKPVKRKARNRARA